MAKFSLHQQIEEVEYEIGMRKDVYPRLVIQHKMRESVAIYHTERMQAVLTTLKWFLENEGDIRAAVEAKRAGTVEPGDVSE